MFKFGSLKAADPYPVKSLFHWLFLVFPVFFNHCDFISHPLPEQAIHTTPHFRLYYPEEGFSRQEVEAIGEKKERLLQYINTRIEVNFDGIITTYLTIEYTACGRAYVKSNQVAYEGRSYAMNDDGHEIVHIVCMAELGGTCRNKFIMEGIATALEYRDPDEHPIDEYVDYRTGNDGNNGDSAWRSDYESIPEQLQGYSFDYSYYSYLQAGAFVSHLIGCFGIGNLKELYRETLAYKSRSEFNDCFEGIYGRTLQSVYEQFVELYFGTDDNIIDLDDYILDTIDYIQM